MTPEPEKPASTAEVEAGAAASVAAAAVTLEAVQDAIYEEGELSKDRQDELLKEVRECRSRLEALSDSMALGAKTENPAIQQLLMEVGRIQTEVQAIRAELSVLSEDEAITENEEDLESRDGQSPRSIVPNSKPEESAGPLSETPSSTTKPPESNPSATPPPPAKKKRYIRI